MCVHTARAHLHPHNQLDGFLPIRLNPFELVDHLSRPRLLPTQTTSVPLSKFHDPV